MIEGPLPGGQLTQTTEVDNYPGYPDGRTGPDMMEDLKKQALRFETDIRSGWVTKVDFTGPVHKVWVDEKTEIHARSVIISTGASANWLGLPNEMRLRDIGGGVTACAVCDGFFYKGQTVAFVGAGDTACEEATYLAKLCPKVYMLVRKDAFRASKAMVHRVENTPQIEVLYNTEVKDVLGEHAVEGVIAVNNKTGEERKLDVTGLFVAIGHKPATDLFKGWLDMDEHGLPEAQARQHHTNMPGVFVAGDARTRCTARP
jgi:thioredoxin reductase (NADPH)